MSRSKCKHQGPPHCTPSIEPTHWSDPDLSKRGAEKICGLLGLGAKFQGMEDFRKAALNGVDIKQIIIDCHLVNAQDKTLSQGTGSCSLEEMYGDLNGAMKRAAKRAYVDAVKRCAGLSGLATELKRRMPPVDPEEAKRQAERTLRTAQTKPGVTPNRYSTGAILTHCPIGKTTKGKPWREIEGHHLEWFVANCVDKPDVVRAAADELSRRKPLPKGTPDAQHAQQPPGSPSQQEEFDDDIPF